MDYDLWIRLGRMAPLRYLPRQLAQVRLHPDTKTASGGMRRLLEIEGMIRRYGRSVLPDSFQGEMIAAASGTLIAALREGRWSDVCRSVSSLARYAPRIATRRVRRTLGHGT
jgi:hypothetical protein